MGSLFTLRALSERDDAAAESGPQYARPASDLALASWTDQAGGTTSVYAAIDEVTGDDGDDARCVAPATAQLAQFSLSAVTDPVSSSGHVVRWRARVVNRVDDAITLAIRLRQGTTLIATARSGAITNAAFAAGEYTLSGAEADAITDYSALRLELVAAGWSNDAGARVEVSWAEVEVPAAA